MEKAETFVHLHGIVEAHTKYENLKHAIEVH